MPSVDLVKSLKGSHLSWKDKLELVKSTCAEGSSVKGVYIPNKLELVFDFLTQSMIKNTGITTKQDHLDCWSLLHKTMKEGQEAMSTWNAKVPTSNMFLKALQPLLLDVDKVLLVHVIECLEYMTQTPFVQYTLLRPTLEQGVELLQVSLQLSSKLLLQHHQEAEHVYRLLSTNMTICQRLFTSNQHKKVFQLMVSTVLIPYFQTRMVLKQSNVAFVKDLDALIFTTLFDAEHTHEFVSTLQSHFVHILDPNHQVPTGGISNYVMSLFQTIEQNCTLEAMDAFAVCIKYFCSSKRTLKGNLQSGYIEMIFAGQLLHNLKEKYQQDRLNMGLKALASISESFDILLEMNVYRAANIKTAKLVEKYLQQQCQWMLTIMKTGTASKDEMKYCLLSLESLLKMDFDIFRPFLKEFMDILVQDVDALDEISILGPLFESYRKMSALDSLMGQWYESLRSTTSGSMPLFVTLGGFAHLSDCLEQCMPSEVFKVTQLTLNELLTHFVPGESLFKKGKAKKKDMRGNPLHLSHILELLVQHFHRMSTIQMKSLEKNMSTFYNDYIHHILMGLCNGKQVDEGIVNQYILPALKCHLALIEKSQWYWEQFNKEELVDQLVAVKTTDEKVQELLLKIALSHSERVLSITLDSSILEQVGRWVRYVTVSTSLFSGQPESMISLSSSKKRSATQDKLVLGSSEAFMAVGSHLTAISRYITRDELVFFVQGLLRRWIDFSVTNKQQEEYLLIVELFRSAKFFEVRPIRDVFSTCFSHSLLRECKVLGVGSCGALEKLVDVLSSMNLKQIQEKLHMYLQEPKETSRVEWTVGLGLGLKRLHALLSLVQMMPLSVYFTASERDVLVLQLWVVDVMLNSLSCRLKEKNLETKEFLVKSHIVCRQMLVCLMMSRQEKLASLITQPMIHYFHASLSLFTEKDVKEKTLYSISAVLHSRLIKALYEKDVSLKDVAVADSKDPIDYMLTVTRAWLEFVENHKESISNKRPEMWDLADKCIQAAQSTIEQDLQVLIENRDRLNSSLDDILCRQDVFQIVLKYYLIRGVDSSLQRGLSLLLDFIALAKDPNLECYQRTDFKLFTSKNIYMMALIGCALKGFDNVQVIQELVKIMIVLCRNISEQEPIKEISQYCIDAFDMLVGYTSVQQLDILSQLIWQSIPAIPSDAPWSIYHLILAFCESIVKAPRKSRRQFSLMLVNFMSLLNNNMAMSCATKILDIYFALVSNPAFEVKSEELALILQGISTLNSSSLYNKLKSSQFLPTQTACQEVFESICRLLVALVKYRKEELIKVIPGFFGVIKGLLHCFRAPAGASTAAYLRDAWENKGQITTSLNLNGTLSHIDDDTMCCFLAHYAPLSIECAQSLERVFEVIPQKQAKSQQYEAEHEHVDLKANSAFIKPFAKHGIHLIAEYIGIQLSERAILFPMGNNKNPIVRGMYYLLDMCGDNETEYVLAALGQGSAKGGLPGSVGHLSSHRNSMGSVGKDAARTLFKHLFSEYKSKHKYSGK